MKIADEYFNRCRETVMRHPELVGRKVRYQDFARKEGVMVGCNRAVNFIKENTYCPVRITGLQDGEVFYPGDPVMTVEVLYVELVTLETTRLGFYSYSGAAKNMRAIVEAADGVPVIDMSARHYPWQIIEEVSLAAYIGGASGTSTREGRAYVKKWYNPSEDDFRVYASIPHSQAAFLAEVAEEKGVFPSVMAGIYFRETYPDEPLTLLVDYEGRELDVVRQAHEVFGNKLFAVRLDTHGGRNMQGTFPIGEETKAREYVKKRFNNLPRVDDSDFLRYYVGNGVTVEAVFRMREFLVSLETSAHQVEIVVSSGFDEKKINIFRQAGAPMNFIGTGSWVDFMMFTSDISHVWEKGEWKFRTKAGRHHNPPKNHKLLFER